MVNKCFLRYNMRFNAIIKCFSCWDVHTNNQKYCDMYENVS